MNFAKILSCLKRANGADDTRAGDAKDVHRLRISGVKAAAITPEPDNAEIAAQAVLEILLDDGTRKAGDRESVTQKSQKSQKVGEGEGGTQKSQKSQKGKESENGHDAEYYRRLAERIRAAHEQGRRMCMRYVAYCEQELRGSVTSETLATLEHGLYSHLDTVNREGGHLLRRWQYCLADIVVQQMQQPSDIEE